MSEDPSAQELKKLTERLSKLTKILTLTSGPLAMSPYWTWFQKNGRNISIPAGKTVPLLLTSDFPYKPAGTQAAPQLGQTIGYLHSFDIQASSGLLQVSDVYSSQNQQFELTGTLLEFWLAGFNPRLPVSAGDPLVINRAVDEPDAVKISSVPEWVARISPSWNLPFNSPFKFTVTNTDPSTTIAVYGYEIFCILLTPDGVNLVRDFWTKAGY